ncbi:hypothetical protein [Streptosporangium sp. NPDC000509]|uniref:hypothetical protein n=1 Tax=Streptosporangium sp. NPDC000509 TaxID=3366186 RepID=UPI0036A48338
MSDRRVEPAENPGAPGAGPVLSLTPTFVVLPAVPALAGAGSIERPGDRHASRR